MFYVYILKSRIDKKLYIGYTANLKRRVVEHNEGLSRSTKPRRPLDLIYYEAYASQADAEQREFRLKNSAGAYTALKRRIKDCLRLSHLV